MYLLVTRRFGWLQDNCQQVVDVCFLYKGRVVITYPGGPDSREVLMAANGEEERLMESVQSEVAWLLKRPTDRRRGVPSRRANWPVVQPGG